MQKIKEGIEGHAVDWYSDVFGIIFPQVDAERVSKLWKKQLKEPKKKKEEKDDEDED